MSSYTTPPAETITPYMVEALTQTRPWVRFLSILGFLTTALLALFGLFFIGLGATGTALSRSQFGGGAGIGVGFVYLLISLLYLFASLFLFRYASGIASMAHDTAGGMERALAAQKSFWRLIGITAAVYLVFVALAFAVTMTVAMIGLMGRH
jgi:hypothetical protein